MSTLQFKVRSQDDLELALHGKTRPAFLPVSTSTFLSMILICVKDQVIIHLAITSVLLTGGKNETSEIGVFTKNRFYC